MGYFELVIYRSLIIFVFHRFGQCEGFQFDLELDSVRIENREEKWESVWLSKNLDKWAFNNADLNKLCGGAFRWSDIEIVEVFNRAMRFSLINGETNDQLFVNVLFSAKDSVDVFFGDIRWLQLKGYGSQVTIEKLYQYQTFETENNDEPLRLLAHHIVSYPKKLNAHRFPNPRTYNFTKNGYNCRFQGVQLVMLSKTFNISKEIGVNNFVLCSANIPTHKFIIRFSRASSTNHFLTYVRDDLNHLIPCSPDWVTKDMLKELRSRIDESGSPIHPVKREVDEKLEIIG